ncbi:MAG: PilZ domain-containing protein [Planctomycetes bacterium]|nr:PilZ domain-containing protein [Planctomycetota bacterium]
MSERSYRPVPMDPPAAARLSAACHVLDVGIGGLFVATAQTLPLGSELTVDFVLPDGSGTLRAGCEVVYAGPYPGGGERPPLGLELAFRGIALEDRLRITRFVRNRYEAQRRFTRHRVTLPVIYRHDERMVEGTILDLSLGGAFIQATRAPPLESYLGLRFDLPEAPRPVRALGRVRKVVGEEERAAEGLECTGMGVEFHELRPEDRVLIRNFLERAGA